MAMVFDAEGHDLFSTPFEKHEVERSIIDRFEQQVDRCPDRLAVKCAERGLTYAQLNQTANRIAHSLLAKHEDREEPIALLLEHDLLVIAALLGVLKAGKIYVPLDPTLPLARLAYLLADAQASLVLTNTQNMSLARVLPQPAPTVVNLDELTPSLLTTNPGVSISPETLGYLLYTSGSTGQPKGVPHSHRNVLVDIRRQTRDLHITRDDHFALLFSCSSGASVAPIFGALLNGAALFPFDLQGDGLTRFGQWLAQNAITICDISVLAFRQFASTLPRAPQFPRLRLISLGGDTVSANDVALYQAHFSPSCVLQNAFGTTETRTIAQCFIDMHTRLEGEVAPVGQAVEDKQVLLLDEEGHEVGLGHIGEIAVKSRYLSPGYWHKPELTRAVFLPDPQGSSERIYLTGDLGRRQADGSLLHLGRKDSQVKVRGFRVETMEIELALLSLETVKAAAVLVHDDPSGAQRVVAYLVPARLPAPTVSTVRASLAQKLPSYMLPAAFVIVDALPLTPNGKVDRRALPTPSWTRPRLESACVAPRDPIEYALAGLWEDILQIEPVGIDDDFLDLGGDSLRATRILSALRATFHTEVPLRLFFQTRTVADLARVVRQSQAAQLNQDPGEQVLLEIEHLSEAESDKGQKVRTKESTQLPSPLATMLSPITPRDIPLYREFFARDQQIACYGNSWAYLTQACRGFGFGLKYYEPGVLLSIGQHKGHYVIVRPLGGIDRRFLTLLSLLRAASGKPVFIKKLFPDQVARLRQLGNFHEAATYHARTGTVSAGQYPWDPVVFADDDTYPELIFDVNVTRQHRLKPREWLLTFQKARSPLAPALPLAVVREHYRKFRRHVQQFLRLDIRCRLDVYQTGEADTVRQFLAHYFGAERLPNVEAYEAMLASFQAMPPEEPRFCFTAHVDGIASPVGFFHGERLDRKSVGSYARVVSRCYPGFPEYLGVRIMSQLSQAGISLLNVGGSETQGVHIFKQKHAPIEERYMQMLVYGIE